MKNFLPSKKPTAADFILSAVLLVLAFTPFVFLNGKKDGAYAEITADGKKTVLKLEKDTSLSFVSGGYSYTVISENGKIKVSESDCPSRDCVKTGSISKPGESVVCVPGGLIIKIYGKGDKNENADFIIP